MTIFTYHTKQNYCGKELVFRLKKDVINITKISTRSWHTFVQLYSVYW